MINKLSLNYRMSSTKDNYYMWYDDDELVAMFRLVDLESDKWICSVFISPKYRKKGLSYDLLHIATSLGGEKLAVNKNNKIAIHTYQKFGFKIFDENKEFYYLRIEEEKGE